MIGEARKVEGALKLVKGSLPDWWLIERAEHDGREWGEPTKYGVAFRRSARITNADIEGSAEEMLDIAAAIKSRGRSWAKRCAVSVLGDVVHLWSPRNSMETAKVSLSVADALAAEILETLTGWDANGSPQGGTPRGPELDAETKREGES